MLYPFLLCYTRFRYTWFHYTRFQFCPLKTQVRHDKLPQAAWTVASTAGCSYAAYAVNNTVWTLKGYCRSFHGNFCFGHSISGNRKMLNKTPQFRHLFQTRLRDIRHGRCHAHPPYNLIGAFQSRDISPFTFLPSSPIESLACWSRAPHEICNLLSSA